MLFLLAIGGTLLLASPAAGILPTGLGVLLGYRLRKTILNPKRLLLSASTFILLGLLAAAVSSATAP